MAEFFDTLEQCWMKVVAKPYDTPLGPGVCDAPTEEELRGEIYSPEVLSRLASLVSLASSKVAEGSIEAHRIALFGREYLEPLVLTNEVVAKTDVARAPSPLQQGRGGLVTPYTRGFAIASNGCSQMTDAAIVNIGLISDIHIGDDNDNSDLKRALRIFDAKKADAVIAAGDLTDFGLLSELQEVAAAWNEVFPSSRRSDGEPVVRLFHYGDHDTALNFKVRQREVVEKGRWADYIPHIGPDVAWERAFGEKFEPVLHRNVKGVEFTLVHFLPDGGVHTSSDRLRGSLRSGDAGDRVARKPWLHVFSQHRAYRGLFARPGCGDEVSWDDGASLDFLTNTPNTVAVCGHAHISATNATSFVAGGGRGATALPDGFAAIAIPSLFYQIETWLPQPKGDHGSHQALFMIATPDGIAVERLDVRTGAKVAPDIEWGIHSSKQALRPL
ncbi:MAG: metallophosphoesterase, partial [Kiritimatiellae bacterium]|nr:metallophosphoesterase [Kiritimatiellia bacterium]